jgi:rubrerythrin
LPVNEDQVHDLLYQALETELGGVQIYEAALTCTRNKDLRGEWEHYLEQTRHHVELVEGSLKAFGLDPAAETPGRAVVRHTGEALVETIALARSDATPEQAQVVAAECVTLAETKDHLNWELIGEVVKRLTGEAAKTLRAAYKEVEEQEDEHLYHNTGWARELWIEGLGIPAVLPPARGAKGRQDGHRRCSSQADSPGHDLVVHQPRPPAISVRHDAAFPREHVFSAYGTGPPAALEALTTLGAPFAMSPPGSSARGSGAIPHAPYRERIGERRALRSRHGRC